MFCMNVNQLTLSVADLRGAQGTRPGSKSFQFHAVFGEI